MTNGPDANDDLLRLDRQLCFPLYAASRLVTRLYQPLLAPFGLTYPQYIVMMVLWERSPLSVTDIGDRLLLNSNTLTPLLKRLEQLGYVRRSRRADDERVAEIALTEAGAALREACRSIPATILANAAFPLDKAVSLKRLLDELLVALRSGDVPEDQSPT